VEFFRIRLWKKEHEGARVIAKRKFEKELSIN
jgi:hypothetical protein